MSTEFSLSPISCLELDKLGVYIAIGYSNGSVAIVKLLNSKLHQQQQGYTSFTTNSNNQYRDNDSNSSNVDQHYQQYVKNKISTSTKKQTTGFKRKKRYILDDEEQDDGDQDDQDSSDNNNGYDGGHGDDTDEDDYISSSGGEDQQQFVMDLDDDYIKHHDKLLKTITSTATPLIIKQTPSPSPPQPTTTSTIPIDFLNNTEYQVLCYFQAHDTQVIQIRWCKEHSRALLFLTTSVSSTILWRLQESMPSSCGALKPIFSTTPNVHSNIPSSTSSSSSSTTTPKNRIKFNLKRLFQHEEIFNINSISLNSDGNTFLSSDELRVYLWDLNQSQYLTIVDLKPDSMQLLQEIIRVTEFHPNQCNYLIIGSSRGSLKLCDMRSSSLINGYAKVFQPKQQNQTIFSDYIDSVLDLKFSNDGRYIVSRNLDTVSIWDINMDHQPFATYNLYNEEYLLSSLYDMYESSYFVDKFQCSFINSTEIITGSYDNKCLIWNPFTSSTSIIQLEKQSFDQDFINLTQNELIQELSPFKNTRSSSNNNSNNSYQHLTNDQAISSYSRLYYSSNFYNIQLSSLSSLLSSSSNSNHSINNSGSSKQQQQQQQLTINNHKQKLQYISTCYSNSTNSLVMSSNNHLFVYK
ncbi:hypothetical protein CYY_000509 [Polysphondylium violaceum]|uniref:WD40 repeat-containing protein n=1 Tax=Polysphondylium violaceum TaxID=133409 RepID=A0A8J4Q4R1_9MYCE|nr:hypothetical protein CYY_000509 [Polysphondylium violaceum]